MILFAVLAAVYLTVGTMIGALHFVVGMLDNEPAECLRGLLDPLLWPLTLLRMRRW